MNDFRMEPSATPHASAGNKKGRRKKTRLEDMERQLIDGHFRPLDSIVLSDLNFSGLYCIRVKQDAPLPDRYLKYLKPHRLLCIGKAQGETLKEHICNRELKEIGQGTFIRTLGAVLDCRPVEGSLSGGGGKAGYAFTGPDMAKIINWMREYLEINWIKLTKDFPLERQLIKKYTPLLNIAHNPLRVRELQEDKKRCRDIASGGNGGFRSFRISTVEAG